MSERGGSSCGGGGEARARARWAARGAHELVTFEMSLGDGQPKDRSTGGGGGAARFPEPFAGPRACAQDPPPELAVDANADLIATHRSRWGSHAVEP